MCKATWQNVITKSRVQAAAVTGLLLLLTMTVVAEGPYGSRLHRKRGIMDGNLIVTEFFNYGMIANWPNQPGGVWPKGTNHSYIDGVAMIVAASTYDEDGNLIHPISTQYREEMDYDPVTQNPLGWEPLPGYANPNQDEPAMSDNYRSWPFSWPDRDGSWDGFWNGYFGKGVTNADLETYFKMDDSQDDEYNFYPDATDSLRRGLGVEVGVRGFQWNHILAEDCIFWHYDITNISTTDYDSTVFGFYIDWGVGGTDNSSDDAGSYILDIDLAYAWDADNEGDNGWSPVGYSGFAFLESPGNATDGIDNDNDGMIDESRDDGIDNDGDWEPFLDRNENGVWDEDEPLMDDLGEDGIGPSDLGYTGPDAGQGDGQPTPGEPDFDALDKDESDQIGLTAFLIFAVHDYGLHREEENWRLMSRLIPPTDDQLAGVNLAMMFYSGTFPLEVGRTERFSMAVLFGNDQNDLVRNKKTVQAIYNANYNFAQPPYKPTLNALAGNERVTLYWNDWAEQSYDRFLQENDFEGYRIYRSTDPSFIDTKVITDAYGNESFRKPLAQFDLKDGRFGPHPVNVYGASFDLGEDTGLRHSYIDTTVMNGITYYYAVVSYDYGFVEGETLIDTTWLENSDSTWFEVEVRFVPELDPTGNIIGIAPSECPSVIVGEVGGTVSLDINTAAVTPNAPSAGYRPPRVDGGVQHTSGRATGEVEVTILNRDSLQDGHTYEIRFDEAENFGNLIVPFPNRFHVLNITDSDTIFSSEPGEFGYFAPYREGDPLFWIDPGVLRKNRIFMEDPEADTASFWHQSQAYVEPPILEGLSIIPTNAYIDYTNPLNDGIDTVYTRMPNNPTYSGNIELYTDRGGTQLSMKIPYNFEVEWYDEYVDTSLGVLGFREDSVTFKVRNTTLDEESDFVYRAIEDTFRTESGVLDTIITEMIIMPYMTYRDTLANRDRHVFGPAAHLHVDGAAIDTAITGMDTTITRTDYPIVLPGEGDMVGWMVPIPFNSSDVYRFTVRQGSLSEQLAEQEMDRIAVVPNPYVATAAWEPNLGFRQGRGDRKIDFIHLPRRCTIRIYTISGYLVDTIEHNSAMENGAASWDLVSRDGMDVAYGVYVFHVDAPGVGEHIGKFAVIK